MLRYPSPKQLEVVESRGKVVLKSCPGSGKTFVVAKKMVKEISSWHEKNRGVALLSFTNVANDEVNRQIEQISGVAQVSYPHFIGTIDSFLFKWLFLPFGHLVMGCKNTPSLLQNTSPVLEFAEMIWRRECWSSGCNSLDFFMDSDGSVKHLYRNIQCSIYKKPCETFKRHCLKLGLATHADATRISLGILESYPRIGKALSQRFPIIIIDEAQDTSAWQMSIVDKLIEYGLKEVYIVGDPDQAIYEWRDADPSVFLEKYHHSNWNKKLLNENYRCSQKICNATHVFSTLEFASTAVGDSADSAFKPLILKYNPKEKHAVIEEFLKICDSEGIDVTPDNVAVLARGKSSLFGKDYSQINNLWQSRESAVLSEATFERALGSITKAKKLVELALFWVCIEPDYSISEISPERIEEVIPFDIWTKMVHRFLIKLPSADTPLKKWKHEIEALIHSVGREFDINGNCNIKIKSRDKNCPDFPVQPLKYFYAKSNRLQYENATIHAVKGKTFEAVLLLLSTTGKLTSKMINTYPIESETIRTAYVAMTRARKVLVAAIPSSVKNNSLERFSSAHWDIQEM